MLPLGCHTGTTPKVRSLDTTGEIWVLVKKKHVVMKDCLVVGFKPAEKNIRDHHLISMLEEQKGFEKPPARYHQLRSITSPL